MHSFGKDDHKVQRYIWKMLISSCDYMMMTMKMKMIRMMTMIIISNVIDINSIVIVINKFIIHGPYIVLEWKGVLYVLEFKIHDLELYALDHLAYISYD
jgi:hypothetical protein